MSINIIAAMSIVDQVIGSNGTMPWDLPDDLKRFRKITMGNTVVMGRKTYESIGQPLEGRQNIIITRQPNYIVPNATVVDSVENALMVARLTNDEIFIIGGGEIYRQTIDLADRLYLTLVMSEIKGDTTFPVVDPDIWRVTNSSEMNSDPMNSHPTVFVDYKRRDK